MCDVCSASFLAYHTIFPDRLKHLVGAVDSGKVEFKEDENAPQQDNGRDCGVFVCLNAQHIVCGTKANSTPKDAADARIAILEEATKRAKRLKK